MSDDGSATDDPARPTAHDDETRDDDAPLSELAERINRQRTDRSDDAAEPPDFDPDLSEEPPDPDDDPFDRMSVGEIDEETLWSSLGSEESVGVGVDVDADAGGGSLGDVGPAPEVESVGDDGSAAREHVVPKDKYCQSCPYLAAPPELRCTHEGTEIVEVVGSERFRVRNCPMVEGGVEPQE
ncbi:hypothetical protein [Halobellus ruber]|uniref:DUF8135 domain-containing protein n=1 Tax=Halobellus ruber TaxID=2761102 RepID=A0A7J9SFQ8_9EURY|nr:hypothetical protein [Halobellus ruber]MBB6645213.1 hypothetical protein [Halobellus ruber]